jgi:hypothetical protein
MNQVRFEFDLKMFVDQFCKIEHISQTIYRILDFTGIY